MYIQLGTRDMLFTVYHDSAINTPGKSVCSQLEKWSRCFQSWDKNISRKYQLHYNVI